MSGAMANIVLASKSPRRQELLRNIGLTDFDIRVPEADESYPAGLTAQQVVAYISRVKAEAAAELYALCVEAAKAAGWKDAVKPEQLTGIVSAMLRVKGEEFPLTDGAALDKLESMLSSGTYSLGGTGCPFTALLDVTTEAGEELTVALATDSCGVWMSEGYYYEYGNDSQTLFGLFGVTLEDLAPWT